MNLGKPSHFASGDSETKRAKSLNDTFANVWRLLDRLIPTTEAAASAATVYGHTSAMPDNNAANKDHDRAYYPRYDAEMMAYRIALAVS